MKRNQNQYSRQEISDIILLAASRAGLDKKWAKDASVDNDGKYVRLVKDIVWYNGRESKRYFDPFSYSSDAIQLMELLKIGVNFIEDGSIETSIKNDRGECVSLYRDEDVENDDIDARFRFAVVMCAAQQP